MARKQVQKLAFTYEETAEAAGVSEALVRKLVASGKLEVVKINRCARIPRHALLRLCGEVPNERGRQ
jgi:excisionase family DNA binding protein